MNNNSKVSVIVPIYNAAEYLENNIYSIINQTYRNIEIILVDDGSTDNSLEICEKVKSKDSRIRLISKENGGVSTARNEGLKKATGKWVMFMDPDDYLEVTIIERLLTNLSTDTDIISASCTSFTSEEKRVVHFFDGNRVFKTKNQKKMLFMQLLWPEYGQSTSFAYTAIGVPWGKLYRKNFLDDNNLFFNNGLRRMQDNIFNMYAFYYAKEIKYIDEPLYNYRYEHMNGYFSTYKKGTTKIFTNVIIERYKGLNALDLYKDKDIFVCYVNECIRLLTIILKNDLFNKNNLVNIRDKRNDYRRLLKLPEFNDVLKWKNLMTIRNSKQKVIMFLVLMKMDYLLMLLCRNF